MYRVTIVQLLYVRTGTISFYRSNVLHTMVYRYRYTDTAEYNVPQYYRSRYHSYTAVYLCTHLYSMYYR